MGNFAAGTITANLIGNVTGSASGCLPLTGGILTGSLILPAGSSASPSLTFTSSTTSGFSCEVANVISVDISNISVVRFSSNGLSLPGITVNHILYTNATGIISDVTIGAGLSFSSGILTSTGTTYTPGTGVNISSNVISIGQDVATTSNVQFASVINSTIGTGNQIFGTSSLSNASSSGNVAIGASALSNGTACSNNIVIGNSSGLLVTTGINNVLLGAYTTLASASNSNSIVIGYNAIGKGSNTAVYGNSGITQHYFTSGMLFADGLTLTNISPNIGIAYINGLKRIGIQGERIAHNNDFYYYNYLSGTIGSGTSNKYWADMSLAFHVQYDYKQLLFSGFVNFTNSLNYHWVKLDGIGYADPSPLSDRKNTQASFTISYFFKRNAASLLHLPD